MGSRRGFIIRMRLGDVAVDPMASPSQPVRARHRNTLGPSSDGRQYAVVHVTGYIRNWPPTSELRFVIGCVLSGETLRLRLIANLCQTLILIIIILASFCH